MSRVWTVLLLLCALLSGAPRLILALRFNNLLAYAIFNRWDATTNGTLLFEFKTHKENGFLMYEDNPSGMDFIDIFLVDGKARMRMHVGQCEQMEAYVDGNFSDNQWHRVQIFRNFQSTILKVDHHRSKSITCKAKDSSFTVSSPLYVGGFPLDISLNSLAFPGSFYEIYGNRFVGCVSGVKYSDVLGRFTPAQLRNSSGTTADCNRACTRPYEFIMNCKHGKGCGKKIAECDCLETGYEGKDCTRESSSIWLNGTGYIRYNVAKETRSKTPIRNFIGFRFRTSNREGVLMYTSLRRTHMIVELISGNVVFKMDLGKGELVLNAGNGVLNDNRWHWVEIKRRGQHAKLFLDGREAGKGHTPGSSSKLVLKGGKEAIYFGGGPSIAGLERSYSKTNFSGYLQQFLFDDYKILDKVLIDKRDNKRDRRFTKHGLVLNAKVWTTVATTPKPATPTTIFEGSANCGDSDDEDCMTRESSLPTQSSDLLSNSTDGTNSSLNYDIDSQHGRSQSLGVPAWIITITVVAAVISIFITVFLVYRWNTRYSGSFSTASAVPVPVPKPEQQPQRPARSWPKPPPRIPVVTSPIPITVRMEHPMIYVSSYDKV